MKNLRQIGTVFCILGIFISAVGLYLCFLRQRIPPVLPAGLCVLTVGIAQLVQYRYHNERRQQRMLTENQELLVHYKASQFALLLGLTAELLAGVVLSTFFEDSVLNLTGAALCVTAILQAGVYGIAFQIYRYRMKKK